MSNEHESRTLVFLYMFSKEELDIIREDTLGRDDDEDIIKWMQDTLNMELENRIAMKEMNNEDVDGSASSTTMR